MNVIKIKQWKAPKLNKTIISVLATRIIPAMIPLVVWTFSAFISLTCPYLQPAPLWLWHMLIIGSLHLKVFSGPILELFRLILLLAWLLAGMGYLILLVVEPLDNQHLVTSGSTFQIQCLVSSTLLLNMSRYMVEFTNYRTLVWYHLLLYWWTIKPPGWWAYSLSKQPFKYHWSPLTEYLL